MRNTTYPNLSVSEQKGSFDAVQLLSRYVQFPSVSGNEEAAGRFFAQQCRQNGLHLHFFTQGAGQLNFAASLYPLDCGKPNIVFLNHIDGAEGGDEAEWLHPPFSGVISEGFVWGRGAYDNKGLAVMQLYAVSRFVELAKAKDLPYNVTLLSVSGEEIFSDLGAKQVADFYLQILNPVVVIGEGPVGLKEVIPGNPAQWVFGISVANKRVLWLNLSLKIKTRGHGSVPPKDHALQSMINALQRISKIKTPIKLDDLAYTGMENMGHLMQNWKGAILKNARRLAYPVKLFLSADEMLAPFYSDTILVSTVETEDKAHNIISKKVTAKLDCRLLPQTDTHAFIEMLKIKMKDPRIQISIEKETPNAMPSDSNHPLYTLLADSVAAEYPGAAVFPMMLPNTSDCNAFRKKGVPVFSTVPVKMNKELIDCIHGPNERIPVAALEEGQRVFVRFLQNVFSEA